MKEMILIRFTSSSKLENNELLNSILIAMIGINTIAIMKMRAFWAPNLVLRSDLRYTYFLRYLLY